MHFPTAAAVADPIDPTSQIPWPSRHGPGGSQSSNDQDIPYPSQSISEHRKRNAHIITTESHSEIPHTRLLTKWNLFTLSLGMAGAQVAWTVELGYGTPFLLSLGLSEQLTSLVWLAGPISGLIAQPLIGAISDSSASRYRRRFWIAWSTVVLVVSCLFLAYAEDVSAVLLDLFGAGVGDWDPQRRSEAKSTAIGIAIIAFYLLDFALNALQASLRNLLLDIAPPEQISAGNAWHGRMTHAGNIVGFGCGFLNLAGWPVLRALGGSQFRKFCVVGIIILVITVWVTCWTQDERPRPNTTQKRSGLREVLGNIHKSVLNLPMPIRKVCVVQIFAFMAWFPFLFYATTYIGQVMAREKNSDPDVDVATRAGNFALLLYSIVAVIAGSLLPELTRRDERLLCTEDDADEGAEVERIRTTVKAWKTEAAAQGKSLKLPRMPLTLRAMWSFALALYGVISLWTFFINTVATATCAVALIGISWAVAVWAPFAMIMEFLKEVEEAHRRSARTSQSRRSSRAPSRTPNERSALLHNDPEQISDSTISNTYPVAGGTVLGIHNLAIVFPQFIIALIASLIFRIVDDTPSVTGEPTAIYLGKNGVAWVLRFGGLSAFIGAVLVRWIPPTEQEKRMHRRLVEMKVARRTLRLGE